MAREVLLVGSVGLRDAEEVFLTAGRILGDSIRRGLGRHSEQDIAELLRTHKQVAR